MRSSAEFRQELNQALDFDKVLALVAARASFSCSEKAILSSLPNLDRYEVQEALTLVKEAMELEQKALLPSMTGISDVSELVSMCEKGMNLSPAQIASVATFLQGADLAAKKLDNELAPHLKELAETIDPCTKLVRAITEKIDLSGQVKEDATPELKRLNQRLIGARADLANKSRQFVKANVNKLQEQMTTTIGSRLCVLVKAADKFSLGGMIHGQSASGAAFYVEPAAFVGLNNELASLQSDIEEEKAKICRELCTKIKENATAILSDLETLTILDVAMAKARWAVGNDGCVPQISTRSRKLSFDHARHPLIDDQKVVANRYDLQENQYCLMISGPNMGGKTVTLKTIGLFVALGHAGFPVKAHKALMGWYEELWFDIGDNQSIENNLSTFSAHISKISQICNHASHRSFFLLDEIGNGTDPSQGEALAQAILEHLIAKKSTVITSTHYNGVKAFGKSQENVLVSSVEFDPKTLKPTYRYIPGISGASYAFSIASSFHLDPSIIERAEKLKLDNEDQVQKQLEALEKQQEEALKKQERFDKLIEQAHQIQKQAAQEKNSWQQKKAALDEEYQQQLAAMLEEKEKEAKEIIKKMRAGTEIKSHKQIELLHEMHELNEQQEQEEEKTVSEEFKAGDYVRITGLNLHGQISEVKKNKATVLVNGKKTTVKLSTLEKMARPKPDKPSRAVKKDRVFTSFPLELNIIGMRVEEGIAALDHYLDQAVYKNVTQVRIIHGVGTGALRKAVWNELAKTSNIKSYSAAGPAEGGLGATIVVLK
jgi:DNA mismatch repair protein MutS2